MMRLTAATAILAIASRQTPARHAGLSRAIHASAAGAANKNKKRPTKGTNLRKPVTPPPKAVPEVKSGTGISDKIQGVRFNFMPKDAVSWATGLSGQVVVQDRGVNKASRSWCYYQLVRARMGFSFKLMVPKVLRWKAIYLPVWNLDHAVSLNHRILGNDYRLDLTHFDLNVPATWVEPLASVPLQLPPSSKYAEEAEPYNLYRHLDVFKQEDMPIGEPIVRPTVIPFSAIPPDLEDMYRKSVSTFQGDEFSFPGEVEVRSQAAYPLLLPYYLVEVAGQNPFYKTEPVTTCLIFGRQFPEGIPKPNFSREGAWLGESEEVGEIIVTMARKLKAGEDFSGYGPVTEDLALAASRQLTRTAFQNAKATCMKLKPNIKLSEVGEILDPIDHVMGFTTCAEPNRKHLLAESKVRHAESKLQVAQAIISTGFNLNPTSMPSLLSWFLPKWMIAKKAKKVSLKDLLVEYDAAKEEARPAMPPWLRR